ncbi:hypothetical protein [Scytonema sp. NUACC26]|uniref:hypothetical protein n=1 Tax=Scytonema sp. NUACC26 TaxID=3140176 RepID=UPI0034DBBAB9
MNSTIAHQSQLNTTSNPLISTPPRQRGLVATWIEVNDKLVCIWNDPNSEELSKSV